MKGWTTPLQMSLLKHEDFLYFEMFGLQLLDLCVGME